MLGDEFNNYKLVENIKSCNFFQIPKIRSVVVSMKYIITMLARQYNYN